MRQSMQPPIVQIQKFPAPLSQTAFTWVGYRVVVFRVLANGNDLSEATSHDKILFLVCPGV